MAPAAPVRPEGRDPAGARRHDSLGAVSRLALAVVLALAATVPACSGSDGDRVSSKSSTSSRIAPSRCPDGGFVRRDLRYAKREGVPAGANSLDVYPTLRSCKAPVVVWVHGGGWRSGDKANGAIPKAVLFTQAGYVFVSVNYRLYDADDTRPAVYPAANEDVAAALAWVHDHIGDYGGDPDRIALLGHSAGAQIAASVGLDPRYLRAHDLGLDTLACIGPLDTEGFAVQEVASNPVYADVFGTDPEVWVEASPVTYATPGTKAGDVLLVERGRPVRVGQTQRFADVLRAAGVPVTAVAAPMYTHAQVNTKIGQADDTVITPALMAFLADCLDA